MTKVTKFESGSHSDSTALKESPQKSGSHKSLVEPLKVSAQEDLRRHDTVVAGSSRQGGVAVEDFRWQTGAAGYLVGFDGGAVGAGGGLLGFGGRQSHSPAVAWLRLSSVT